MNQEFCSKWVQEPGKVKTLKYNRLIDHNMKASKLIHHESEKQFKQFEG